MAEPSEVDQKSDNCTFILKLHHRYLYSPGKELFPRLGAVQILHSVEVKAQHSWELFCGLCSSPSSLTVQRTGTTTAALWRAAEEKPTFWYLLEAPSIIRKTVCFLLWKGIQKGPFPKLWQLLGARDISQCNQCVWGSFPGQWVQWSCSPVPSHGHSQLLLGENQILLDSSWKTTLCRCGIL